MALLSLRAKLLFTVCSGNLAAKPIVDSDCRNFKISDKTEMNRIMSNIKPSPRTRRQKQLKSNEEIKRDDSSDISEIYPEFDSG